MANSEKDDWEDVPIDDWQDVDPSTPPATTLGDVGDAAMRGAAQGITLGHADEAAAVLGGGVDYIQGKLGLRGDIDFEDAYRTRRDAIRRADNEAREKAPGTFKAAEVAGGLAPFLLGGGAAAATQTLGKMVATGAATGAAAGSGYSEGDFGSSEHLTDVATGGGLGTFAGLAGRGAMAGLGKLNLGGRLGLARRGLSDKLKGIAERRATKAATGNQAKYYKPLERKGRLEERGRELLDQDVVKFGSNARSIADAAKESSDEAGQKIGTILKQIDDEGVVSVNSSRIADKIDELAESIASPNNKAVVANLKAQADEFRHMFREVGGQAKQGVSLQEANRLKGLYKWDERDPASMAIGKEATNRINRIISDEIDEAVNSYAAVPRPGGLKAATEIEPEKALDEYLGAKKTYHHTEGAEQSATDLAAQQGKNRSISLKDTLIGGSGYAATGDPATAAILALGNKVLRERGSSSFAVVADRLAKALKNPTFAEKYGPMLLSGAQKGERSLGAMHTLMMKRDPEYRKLLTDGLFDTEVDLSAKPGPPDKRKELLEKFRGLKGRKP